MEVTEKQEGTCKGCRKKFTTGPELFLYTA